MADMRFDEPVTLLVGLGFPAKIETVSQAYSLLQEWPQARRNSSHKIAMDACKAGLSGDVDCETVRRTLVNFAVRNNILVSNDIVFPGIQRVQSSDQSDTTFGRKI